MGALDGGGGIDLVADERGVEFPERFEDAEAQGRAVAGTPDKVRDFLMKSVRDAGLNYLLCRFAFGDITGDEALNSVDLFTAKVMPDLTALEV